MGRGVAHWDDPRHVSCHELLDRVGKDIFGLEIKMGILG